MTQHFVRLNSGFGRHNFGRDDFRAMTKHQKEALLAECLSFFFFFFLQRMNKKLYILRRGRLRERLRSALVRANVILAEKCVSRRQSTTSFRENVVMAKTSYQMLEILSFSDREKA